MRENGAGGGRLASRRKGLEVKRMTEKRMEGRARENLKKEEEEEEA